MHRSLAPPGQICRATTPLRQRSALERISGSRRFVSRGSDIVLGNASCLRLLHQPCRFWDSSGTGARLTSALGMNIYSCSIFVGQTVSPGSRNARMTFNVQPSPCEDRDLPYAHIRACKRCPDVYVVYTGGHLRCARSRTYLRHADSFLIRRANHIMFVYEYETKVSVSTCSCWHAISHKHVPVEQVQIFLDRLVLSSCLGKCNSINMGSADRQKFM